MSVRRTTRGHFSNSRGVKRASKRERGRGCEQSPASQPFRRRLGASSRPGDSSLSPTGRKNVLTLRNPFRPSRSRSVLLRSQSGDQERQKSTVSARFYGFRFLDLPRQPPLARSTRGTEEKERRRESGFSACIESRLLIDWKPSAPCRAVCSRRLGLIERE